MKNISKTMKQAMTYLTRTERFSSPNATLRHPGGRCFAGSGTKSFRFIAAFLCFTIAWFVLPWSVVNSRSLHAAECPDAFPAWKSEWDDPSPSLRPLQIVHGGIVHYTTPESIAYFKDECGLGGLVCNVGRNDYLYNEEEWARFVRAVRSAKEVGLRIWIYDEDGYPSPEAGGELLKQYPNLECLALAYDRDGKTEQQRFFLRKAFEYTHAASNYAAIRRYPNLLNPETTERFLEITHRQYRDRLGSELFAHVEAFFTDEPSLNAVNIGLIPEDAMKRVPVVDRPDASLNMLPMVPWVEDLPQKYRETYGEDLMPLRKSLFEGNDERDKQVRGNFWKLVATLHSERYYGAIRAWCAENGASLPDAKHPGQALRGVSSGHTLHEESIVAHAALDGNKLQVLRQMDIPGMDMLHSDPRVVFWGAWRAAAFPASAAEATERRLLMTEVSDFSQTQGGEGYVDVDTMCAAAAWQAAWGVTEFTLYYRIVPRGNFADAETAHKRYCDFVGRINAVLRAAEPVRRTYLYYPIAELQAEYLPQADPIDVRKQSERTQRLVQNFDRLGEELSRAQIPFTLTDRRWTPEDMKAQGKGKEYFVESDLSAIPRDRITRIVPASAWVALGHFQRDGREIYLLLNTDANSYEGRLIVPTGTNRHRWSIWNPATGEITTAENTGEPEGYEHVPLRLEKNQTLLLIGEPVDFCTNSDVTGFHENDRTGTSDRKSRWRRAS